MSWDIRLACECCGHEVIERNYTHNTHKMIYDVLLKNGFYPETTWYAVLPKMTGPQGALYLNQIVKGLEANPEKYKAMNPPNGWGDYDSLLEVLKELRDSVPEFPTTWSASG